VTGCEEPAAPTVDPTPVAITPEPVRPPWHVLPEGGHAVTAPVDDAVLAAARDEARATAAAAREAWASASSAARADWYVCWGAPTADGGTEYLWLRVETWNEFRIEGRLVNEPVSPLTVTYWPGDLIGFPAEDLADWMRLGPNGREAGGATVRVLESRHGKPPAEFGSSR
jgi:uncharacterized protein YegJ (DUF2314 family)